MIALTAGAMSFAAPAPAGEVTGAADNLRTGWYPDEPLLAPSLLTEGRFTQLFDKALEGQIYAQPLVANGVLLVATEGNRIYGLDPVTGSMHWKDVLEPPVSSQELPGKCGDLAPQVGVTGTPVIDTEHNVAYFVANEIVKKTATWRMHAIELSSGTEVPGGKFPVTIEGEAENLRPAKVKFEPLQELQRPALLMMNGVIYAGFGSHCDEMPYEGWIAGVSTSGELTTMWATSASGASIWQSGGGLVSDRSGQIIFTTGNGEGLGTDPPPGPGSAPPEGKLGESVVRVEARPGGGLHALDFFSPFNNTKLDEGADLDLGSSAPVALPSPYFSTAKVHDPLVQDGKGGTVYLLDRSNLGGMGQEGGQDKVVQKLGPYGGVWGAAAVWPGDGRYVYIPTVGDPKTFAESHNSLKFFRYGEDGSGNPQLSAPVSTAPDFWFGSGSPIVTSNGTTNGSGVLWIVDCLEKGCGATQGVELRAYTAVPGGPSPEPFWHAKIKSGTKFSRPLASAGHIYVGNQEGHVIAFSGPMLTPSPESPQLTATIGETTTQDLTFTATGTDVEIKEVRSPTAPFSVSGLPPEGTALKPGEAIKVKVSFTPTSIGSANGELVILTKQGSETKVTLSGTGEPTAQERAEQQQRQRERAEREARERSEAAARGAVAPASLLTPPAGTGPLSIEPVPTLTKLKLRASASRLASHRRKLVVTYTLSAPATVVVVIYRRVVSRSCPKGLATCARWVATKLKVRVAAHVGGNTLAMNLGTLSAGAYRMAATPLTRSGARGVSRNLDFRTLR